MKRLSPFAVALAALLAACSPKPTAPDEPPVPRVSWTSPIFLDSGRVGFFEIRWEDFTDYCADYFDWDPCVKQRNFESRFLRIDPATFVVDTLFDVFPRKPGRKPAYGFRAWYQPPRLIYRDTERAGVVNLETGAHQEFATEYIGSANINRSGDALVGDDSERIDLATGKVTRLLPARLTEEPAPATFRVDYHDDVSAKLVLTGTTWPAFDHTYEVLYDLTAKTLDSSRSATARSRVTVQGRWVLRGDTVTAEGTRVAYAARSGHAAGTSLSDTATLKGFSASVEQGTVYVSLSDFDPVGRRILYGLDAYPIRRNGFTLQGFDGAAREFLTRDFRPGYFPDSTANP